MKLPLISSELLLCWLCASNTQLLYRRAHTKHTHTEHTFRISPTTTTTTTDWRCACTKYVNGSLLYRCKCNWLLLLFRICLLKVKHFYSCHAIRSVCYVSCSSKCVLNNSNEFASPRIFSRECLLSLSLLDNMFDLKMCNVVQHPFGCCMADSLHRRSDSNTTQPKNA